MATPKKSPTKASASTKKRAVSDSHKAAMATGREAARTVNAYLTALDEFRPKRGRKVSREELDKRLESAREEAERTIGTARLLAIQLIDDLEKRISSLTNSATDTLEHLEEGFVKAAKSLRRLKGHHLRHLAQGWCAGRIPQARRDYPRFVSGEPPRKRQLETARRLLRMLNRLETGLLH